MAVLNMSLRAAAVLAGAGDALKSGLVVNYNCIAPGLSKVRGVSLTSRTTHRAAPCAVWVVRLTPS
jgi:hypothetical protein